MRQGRRLAIDAHRCPCRKQRSARGPYNTNQPARGAAAARPHFSTQTPPGGSSLIMMRATLTRKSQKAEARRRSSKIWSDLETLREERRQSKAAPTTKRERVLEQLRARSLAVCESSKFMTFMTVLTLYALFGDDAKLCLADSTADDAFVVAAIMCIIFFGVEIVLQCFAYAWYFRGFYFWVDLASTLSILTEIPAVMAEVAILVGGSGGESAEMLKAGKVLRGVLCRHRAVFVTRAAVASRRERRRRLRPMAWDSLDAIDAATTRRDDGVDPLDAIEERRVEAGRLTRHPRRPAAWARKQPRSLEL